MSSTGLVRNLFFCSKFIVFLIVTIILRTSSLWKSEWNRLTSDCKWILLLRSRKWSLFSVLQRAAPWRHHWRVMELTRGKIFYHWRLRKHYVHFDLECAGFCLSCFTTWVAWRRASWATIEVSNLDSCVNAAFSTKFYPSKSRLNTLIKHHHSIFSQIAMNPFRSYTSSASSRNLNLNEAQSPAKSFLSRLPNPFHRPLLQIIYFCAKQGRSLLGRPKTVNAESWPKTDVCANSGSDFKFCNWGT